MNPAIQKAIDDGVIDRSTIGHITKTHKAVNQQPAVSKTLSEVPDHTELIEQHPAAVNDAEARTQALRELKIKSGYNPDTSFGTVAAGCMSADDIIKQSFLVDKPATQADIDKTRKVMEKNGLVFCSCPHDPADDNRDVLIDRKTQVHLCASCKFPIFELNVKIIGNPF